MKKPLYHVTDHAIIRYLERVQGMDIDCLRRQIGHVVQSGRELGACGVVSNGFVYKLRGTYVTTVLPHNTGAAGHKKRRGRVQNV